VLHHTLDERLLFDFGPKVSHLHVVGDHRLDEGGDQVEGTFLVHVQGADELVVDSGVRGEDVFFQAYVEAQHRLVSLLAQ